MIKSITRKEFDELESVPDFMKCTFCRKGVELFASEKKIFYARLTRLLNADTTIIYRGDNRSRVLQKFGSGREDFPAIFNDKLFLIGSKGRSFLHDLNNTINRRKAASGIADTEIGFFSAIFDMIAYALSGRMDSMMQSMQMHTFKLENPSFIKFFADPENKLRFLAVIQSFPDELTLKTRDNYLTFLHHFSDSEYYPISFLMSASRSFRVAKDYSRQRDREDNIVFIGWVPEGHDIVLHSHLFSPEEKEDIAGKYVIPVYSRPILSEEQEVTLKGGLLPHFLLGYYYSMGDSKYFEVNPYFIGKLSKGWINDGLPIDQGEFWEVLKTTAFHSAVILNEKTGAFSA
jgi:hypothetical protein